MTSAVDKVGRGKQRQLNARFRAMVCHFIFAPDCCNRTAAAVIPVPAYMRDSLSLSWWKKENRVLILSLPRNTGVYRNE
jgi:hypothetical protein